MDKIVAPCYLKTLNLGGMGDWRRMLESFSDDGSRLRAIRLLLDRPVLPVFADAFSDAKRLGDLVKEHIAALIGPTLNAELRTRNQRTYEEKKAICRWTNGVLRELGLSIRCPKTGHPAILTAAPTHKAGEGRFRLKTGYELGREHSTESHNELWALELMPDPPRREALAEFNRNRAIS